MNNNIEDLAPPQENKEILKDIKEENFNNSEKIEINFDSHKDLIKHLKSIGEEERNITIKAFIESNRNRIDEEWEKKVQRELLGYFCESGDQENAQEIIGLCLDTRSQKGRIQKFESFFGKNSYEGKIAETTDQKITDEEREILEESFEISKTAHFREALDLGLLKVAENWLNNIIASGKYSNLEGDAFTGFLRDRTKELQDEKNKRDIK